MKSFTFYTFLSLALLMAAPVQAQDAETEEQPPLLEEIKPVLQNKERDTIVTLAIENDLFGSGEDSQYTSGVRLSWFDFNTHMPAFFEHLDDAVPTFDINESTSLFYSIGHNIYTPDDITVAYPDSDQRPYAAFLYGSAGLATISDNHMDEVELTLGVVGPMAQGEEIQDAIHSLINSPDPQGWDNYHLENEPALMLSWRRQWPTAFKQDLPFNLVFTAAPQAGVTLGNVYTYANTGLDFRLRPSSSEFDDPPLRVRPAMPGTGFFTEADDGFDWYLFAGLEGRAMGRNIFLDGNTFEDSPSVDKNYFVGDANVGIAFTFGATRVSYTYVYRTEEFHTQKEPTEFGAISVGYRF